MPYLTTGGPRTPCILARRASNFAVSSATPKKNEKNGVEKVSGFCWVLKGVLSLIELIELQQ